MHTDNTDLLIAGAGSEIQDQYMPQGEMITSITLNWFTWFTNLQKSRSAEWEFFFIYKRRVSGDVSTYFFSF